MFSGGSLVLIFLKHHTMCYQPRPGSPECRHRCCHSLCAGPGAHIGSAVQPELCSGWDPPAPPGSTRPGWTWKTPDNRVSGQLSPLCPAGGDKQRGVLAGKSVFKVTKSSWESCFELRSALTMLPMLPVSGVYLDIVTRVGFGSALRKSSTAEMSVSISRSVLMWWGSSAESQVNPAWCTWTRGDEEEQRMEQQRGGGVNVVMLPLHTSCCGLLQRGVSDGRKNNLICFARYVTQLFFFFFTSYKVSLLAIIRKCIAVILEEKKTGLSFTS